jgi:hypothetical protein
MDTTSNRLTDATAILHACEGKGKKPMKWLLGHALGDSPHVNFNLMGG